MEFRWTVGGRHDDGDSQLRGTAVDVRFAADTRVGSDIRLANEQGRFRQNVDSSDGFLPWQNRGIEVFDSPVPEVRWCFFSSDILPSVRNLARIDGVLFGTDDGEEFCRPELNADDDACLPEHGEFIERYCIALDLAADNCAQVSRLAFSRTGVGEHVWDPTHAEASDEGGSFSVLSPPVRRNEYSCMSLYLEPPQPSGEAFRFAWDFGRRGAAGAAFRAYLRFFFFAPGAGDGHKPEDFRSSDRDGDIFRVLATLKSGFDGWATQPIGDHDTAVGELKWCYYGSNSVVGAQDRGRIDRLQITAGLTQADARPEIEAYCTALNLADEYCQRLSKIVFRNGGEGSPTASRWRVSGVGSGTGGGGGSVVSGRVGDGDYHCMSLHFSEAIDRGSDISCQWSLGRGGTGGYSAGSSTMLIWFAPTAADQPPMLTLGQPGIRWPQAGQQAEFSPWTEHLAVAIDRPVPEIRWCYFGSVPSAGVQDIGRVDRLMISEGIALGFVFSGAQSGSGRR